MGHQALILVMLSTLLLSTAIVGFTGEWQTSNDTVTDQFTGEHALNVANSGVNLAISELRRDKDWRAGFSSLAVGGGDVSVTVTDIGKDSIRLVAVASYSDTSRTVVTTLRIASIMPVIEAALSIYGDSVIVNNAGKAFAIDGRDYKSNGFTLTANPPVWGIGVEHESIDSYLTTKIVSGKISSNVVGKGSNPSVGLFKSDSLDLIFEMLRDMATLTLAPGKYAGNSAIGTLDVPEIVYVNGDMQWAGDTKGAGILVVDGHLQFSGNVQWQGIVIARASGTFIDFGSNGNPRIIGAAIVGNKNGLHLPTVKINGNPSAIYSSEAISTVLENLDMLKVQVMTYYE